VSAKPAPASPPAEPEAEIAEDTEPARASRFVQARQTQAAVGCVKPNRRARKDICCTAYFERGK
jgi:hypothetical protein